MSLQSLKTHPKRTKLTPKQRIFVLAYVKTFNGAQAAMEAGVSSKSADSRASKWKSQPHIAAAIEKAMRGVELRLTMDVDDIVHQLAAIATANLADFFERNEAGTTVLIPYDRLPRHLSAAIMEDVTDQTGGTGDGKREMVLRRRFKLHPKVEALKLLGQYRRMFIERVEHEGTVLLDVSERMRSAAKRIEPKTVNLLPAVSDLEITE